MILWVGSSSDSKQMRNDESVHSPLNIYKNILSKKEKHKFDLFIFFNQGV